MAQPTFIFGRTGGDEKSDEYFKGIAILMAAAVINAIANVLQAIYKGITRPKYGATFAVKSVALCYKPIISTLVVTFWAASLTLKRLTKILDSPLLNTLELLRSVSVNE